ncbi:hypothetical protein K32_36940 [Kaistia sp. 32K]|nr:hypothetical protein K32_36940 [Kaistia sp. 32K]
MNTGQEAFGPALGRCVWIPAFAGMTAEDVAGIFPHSRDSTIILRCPAKPGLAPGQGNDPHSLPLVGRVREGVPPRGSPERVDCFRTGRCRYPHPDPPHKGEGESHRRASS